MIQRCIVAAVLVAALAGLIEQNEASEYELALTRLDNWLVKQPGRAKENSPWQDVNFIREISESRRSRFRTYSALRDRKVRYLVNSLPRFITPNGFKCFDEFWPILRDLNAMIQGSNETTAASSRNDGPLRRFLMSRPKELKECYNQLFLNRFDSVVRSALEKGSGSLSGREVQNQIDEMGRQRWPKHLFDYDSHGGLKGALEAQSRLRSGEFPFRAEGLLKAIGNTIHPEINYYMRFRDEKTGAYVDLKLTKAEVMNLFEKNMKKRCESYVRATRPLVEPVAQLLEKEGFKQHDFGGYDMVYWYVVCEVVLEMKSTEEMADAVVKELEKRHNKP